MSILDRETQADRAEVEAYNPADWVPSDKLLAFRSALKVGSAAPDFPCALLGSGEQVHLSDYWRERDVVVEFGSIT